MIGDGSKTTIEDAPRHASKILMSHPHACDPEIPSRFAPVRKRIKDEKHEHNVRDMHEASSNVLASETVQLIFAEEVFRENLLNTANSVIKEASMQIKTQISLI